MCGVSVMISVMINDDVMCVVQVVDKSVRQTQTSDQWETWVGFCHPRTRGSEGGSTKSRSRAGGTLHAEKQRARDAPSAPQGCLECTASIDHRVKITWLFQCALQRAAFGAAHQTLLDCDDV